MNPFRLVIITGCVATLLGAGYMSYAGVGRESGLASNTPSMRAGSPGGSGSGGFFFGRVK